MKIRIAPKAEKEFKKFPKLDQIALAEKIRSLPGERGASERLSGFSHIFRVRVENYRIVYRKTTVEVYIILIGHRKDIYRKLAELLR